MASRYRLYEIKNINNDISYQGVWDDVNYDTTPPAHIPQNAVLVFVFVDDSREKIESALQSYKRKVLPLRTKRSGVNK